MEWRFGSFRCQSEAARQAIGREAKNAAMAPEERALWELIKVDFSDDPCSPAYNEVPAVLQSPALSSVTSDQYSNDE